MSELVEVSTQAELDEALKRPGVVPVCVGNGRFELSGSVRVRVWGSSSPSIEARESSSPSIEAWESSSPSIEAWESSSPSIEAWGSSSPSIEARESSSPSIKAWESSSPSIKAWGSSSPSIKAWGSSSPSIEARESSSPSIEAWESSSPSIKARESSSPSIKARGSSSPSIEAWESSSPSIEARESSSPSIKVGPTAATVLRPWGRQKPRLVVADGGQLVELPKPDLSTAEKWCAYHGVKVVDGTAVLFKALDADYVSPHGLAYRPGTQPEAPDWDGGAAECGGGLHFSPTPGHARAFLATPGRYVACPVKLDEIVTHPDGLYPAKVKAPRAGGPVWEVDAKGNRVETREEAA